MKPTVDNKEYDPIKKQIGGQAAERVVWTTNALNAAVEGIKKGLPLKANPFIGKNTKLLKPDLVYKRTKEEIDDYIHCMQDPIYFGSKCYLMTPTGLEPCELRDYQIDYLKHLQKNRFSIFLSCRQSGKCFSEMSIVKILIKNNKMFNGLLEKYYFYIDKDSNYVIELPVFELIHLYDKSIIGNTRYLLYKILFKLQLWQVKRDNKLENLKKIVKNFQNTIKNIFQN